MILLFVVKYFPFVLVFLLMEHFVGWHVLWMYVAPLAVDVWEDGIERGYRRGGV